MAGRNTYGAVLADIGGTNARFAVLRDNTLGSIAHLAVADHLQFEDALEAFLARQPDRARLLDGARPGRRAGRIPVPVPGFGVWALDSLRRANRYTEITRDQFNYLSYGRVMDTTRMRSELGYQPKWSTAEAFDDYVRGRGLTPIIDPHRVRSLEGRTVALAQRWGSRNPIPWGGVR